MRRDNKKPHLALSILVGAVMLAACKSSPPRPDVPVEGPPADTTSSGPPPPVACARAKCPQVLYMRGSAGRPRRGVEVDSTDVYWNELAEDGLKVRAAPKTGAGPVRTLGIWHDFESTRALVVDGQHVYWLRPGMLVRVAKGGGDERTFPLPAEASANAGLLEDWGDAILVGAHDCRRAIRMPKDGTAPVVWTISSKPAVGGVTGYSAEGSAVHCASGRSVFALDVRTGVVRELLSDQNMAGPMRVVGGDLYFVNNRSVTRTGENLAVLRAGATSATDLGPVFAQVSRLIYDDARKTFYFLTGLSTGISHIGSYTLGDARTELLFDKMDIMGGSAADATHLYWLADYAVMRLEK